MLLHKLKISLFPCEKIMSALRADHAESVRENQKAHDHLRAACGQGCILNGTFHPNVGVEQFIKRSQ